MQRVRHDGHRLQTVCVVWQRRISLLPSGWDGMRISSPVTNTIKPVTTTTKHSRKHQKAESAQVGNKKLAGTMWLRIALLWKHATECLPSLPKSVSCRTKAENGEHTSWEMRILWSMKFDRSPSSSYNPGGVSPCVHVALTWLSFRKLMDYCSTLSSSFLWSLVATSFLHGPGKFRAWPKEHCWDRCIYCDEVGGGELTAVSPKTKSPARPCLNACSDPNNVLILTWDS